MSHHRTAPPTVTPSNPFLITSRVSCRRASSQCHIVVPISQESKKGFGESSKSHNNKGARQGQTKQQQRGLGNAADTKKAVLLRDGSQELQSVIKSVEKDYAKKHTRRLNIDKDVAARGNVDFVKVESWGDQGKDQSELDDLKVKSFSPAFSSSDSNAPFYERLVHRLQLLESKGDISVVQAQSLPQFQDWVFGENRYLQYLVDQHAVFNTLRLSVSSIQNSAFSNADSSKEEVNIEKAAMAVGIFNDALGLDRSEVKQLPPPYHKTSLQLLEIRKMFTINLEYRLTVVVMKKWVDGKNMTERAPCKDGD